MAEPSSHYSVLILTQNEETNIRDCVSSIFGCDDIVVLDSFSTDQTVSMAENLGLRVFQHTFDGYASQRNFGLAEIEFKHPWVLMLDADERLPPETHDEILREVSRADENTCLMYFRRRDHLFGRWIRRSSGYPTWFGRLVRIGQVRVEREINEEYQTDGPKIYLANHLDHYPFNKGFSEWLAKHNRYSTMEAQLLLQNGRQGPSLRALVTGDSLARRRALKVWAYSLPGRPLWVFLGLYILRGGILEGRAGFTFCCLRAIYEFMIDCKYRELLRRQQGLPV